MRLEINITKKYAFLIVIALIVIAGVSFVIANHPLGTPNPGHDINEIGGIEECASGFVLTHDSSGVRCVVGVSDCFLQIASICPSTNPATPTGWSPDCPVGYTKKGGVDPMSGTGVGWCRTAFSLCCQ